MAAEAKSVKVAVVGSGMMGRGIAACIAAGGPHEVRMFDTQSEALKAGVEKATELLDFLRDNGVAGAKTGVIKGAASLAEAAGDAEFVFEACFEDIKVKQGVFKDLEACTGPETVLCTNTSSLSVTEIAKGCEQTPQRVIAAHFIGPAHLVPLVELCPAEQTEKGPNDGPVERVRLFLEGVGKKPVVLKKEIDGFIAARLQAALYRECMHLYKEGVADCAAIDGAVVNGFGRRLNQIGPFQVADFAGVDLVQKTHGTFFPQLGSYTRDHRADELVKEGRFGVKNQMGHYDWTPSAIEEVAQRRDTELLRRLKMDRGEQTPSH